LLVAVPAFAGAAVQQVPLMLELLRQVV